MKKSNSQKKNAAKNLHKSEERLKNGADNSISNEREKSENMVVKEVSTVIESENGEIKPTVISLKETETTALIQLRETHRTLVLLASKRLESKLSNTRVVGVARELNELIKVMAVYETA